MKTIDLRKMNAEERAQVLAIYTQALKRPDTLLTVQEAAVLYGYTYSTLRSYMCVGRLRGKRVKGQLCLTHAAMRGYLRKKHPSGIRRKALANAQTDLL